MTQFTRPEIWKGQAVLLSKYAGSSNMKISEGRSVNLRTDSYQYCLKVNIQSTSLCLGWSLAIVILWLHSSSHISSDSIRMPERGSVALGSRRWLLEDPASGNRTLHHATQAGKPSVSCQKISATISHQTSCCQTSLDYYCVVQLNERPRKLCVTTKMNWRQG